ncbi:MAG: hypothetical protein ACRBDL_02555 [Alphaproteobacteria bacterium]
MRGQSGDGISYGYKKVVKKFDASGEAIRRDREIDHEEAKVICRIFFQKRQHIGKACSAGLLCGFNVNKLFDNAEAILAGVLM